MKFRNFKYFILFLVAVISFYSCKKEKIDGINNCCCPVVETPTPEVIPERLMDIMANGFFVCKKYYTINGNSTTLDSTVNRAFEIVRGDPKVNYEDHPIPSASNIYYYVDSVKVNNIRFKDLVQWTFGIYVDSTHTNLNSPRHFQFYGDTSLFDNIDYVDNNPIPNYTDYGSLPDSVTYNKNFFVNLGSRTNVMESYLVMKTARFGIFPFYIQYIANNVDSFTIPTDELPYNWNTDQVKITLTLRNWSSIKIKNRDYYFVSEHIYQKN